MTFALHSRNLGARDVSSLLCTSLLCGSPGLSAELAPKQGSVFCGHFSGHYIPYGVGRCLGRVGLAVGQKVGTPISSSPPPGCWSHAHPGNPVVTLCSAETMGRWRQRPVSLVSVVELSHMMSALEGGGGSWKSGPSEGFCEFYTINQIQMRRGSKNPKFCGHHIWKLPCVALTPASVSPKAKAGQPAAGWTRETRLFVRGSPSLSPSLSTCH